MSTSDGVVRAELLGLGGVSSGVVTGALVCANV